MTLEEKIIEIKALIAEQKELEAQIEALEDEIKAEMNLQSVSELNIGDFEVKYTKYASHSFDTTKFKAEHEALYKDFTKEVPAVRLTVN